MFKNKTQDGLNNICGKAIRHLRLQHPDKLSQKKLADKLQIFGIDIDKNAVQRIERGERFITDIELFAFSKVFSVTCDELYRLVRKLM